LLTFKGPLMLFLVGYFKKACVADNIAPYIDQVFASPSQYGTRSLWIAVLLYAVQIYCDFSGYTDMAIASARLLGYELCLNFNFPYFAINVQDFWRRWHVSLSTWLRDYLYIPLGGNHGTPLFAFRNVMLTMLLGGLWHGASWNFVIWGGLHGLALGIHRLYNHFVPETSMPRRMIRMLRVPLTFYWVCIAWIFFRAGDYSRALPILKGFVLFQSTGSKELPFFLVYALLLLGLMHWISYRKPVVRFAERLPDTAYAVSYGFAWFLAVFFTSVRYTPFIYFQF
jgi:alginate O-acetyltransferase complex protein AlgI